MSDKIAETRLRDRISLLDDWDANIILFLLDVTLDHERSAGAAPLDALREAFSDFDPCHECDNAEKAWAALARLSEGTDRAAPLNVDVLTTAWKAYKNALSPRSGVDVMDRLRLLDEFDALMLASEENNAGAAPLVRGHRKDRPLSDDDWHHHIPAVPGNWR